MDPRAFRDALGQFATGVTVITTRTADGGRAGLTSNSFNSVSLTPPLVLWSLALTSTNLAAFVDATHFAVHVLTEEQRDVANQFARKGGDKFEGLDIHAGVGGLPLLPRCAAQFQCRKVAQYEGGDHLIFIGEVLEFESTSSPPLLFHQGRYAAAIDLAARDAAASRTIAAGN
jgi:3-hydroxy-9,10-secoandrosta-1,3,5(10)-triene-9,17-dione monooxygenase reductase component